MPTKAEVVLLDDVMLEYVALVNDLLDYIDNKRVCLNVISKSGTTLETAVAFRMLKKMLTSW